MKIMTKIDIYSDNVLIIDGIIVKINYFPFYYGPHLRTPGDPTLKTTAITYVTLCNNMYCKMYLYSTNVTTHLEYVGL